MPATTTTQCPFCFFTRRRGFSGICPNCNQDTTGIISAIRSGRVPAAPDDLAAYKKLQGIFKGAA